MKRPIFVWLLKSLALHMGRRACMAPRARPTLLWTLLWHVPSSSRFHRLQKLFARCVLILSHAQPITCTWGFFFFLVLFCFVLFCFVFVFVFCFCFLFVFCEAYLKPSWKLVSEIKVWRSSSDSAKIAMSSANLGYWWSYHSCKFLGSGHRVRTVWRLLYKIFIEELWWDSITLSDTNPGWKTSL